MKSILTLFTILCFTTIASATVLETQEEVVFEKACAIEGYTSFLANFNAPKGKAFTVDPRVVGQLSDSRLGSLAGKITPERLHELVNNNAARRFCDTRTGNMGRPRRSINVIQEIEGKLVRITVAGDKFKIISVAPIRERNILNLIENGGFVPQ